MSSQSDDAPSLNEVFSHSALSTRPLSSNNHRYPSATKSRSVVAQPMPTFDSNMPKHTVIVEKSSDWKINFPFMEVVTARDYLARTEYFTLKNARIINLCRDYSYLSRGYYCSLLAEARQHRVVPTVRTLRDLSRKTIYSVDIEDFDDLAQNTFSKEIKPNVGNTVEVYLLFGHTDIPALRKLARQLFATFSCPLMKVEFRYQDKWLIHSVKPVSLSSLPARYDALFCEALNDYVGKKSINNKTKQKFRYDLAILHNPTEVLAPSNPEALEKFVKIGRKLKIDVDLITKKDYARIAEYDALFIRETTHIEHHTYRFAKKAESEGLVVIDDPDSILRCTNKVYLAEMLKANGVGAPKTFILQKDNLYKLEREIPYPIVLKIPDGSFSQGVFKAHNYEEVLEITTRLFKESDILLAQEYIYTPYDWRIGILNRQPIFACQYFMSHEHWQIVKTDSAGQFEHGDFITLPIESAPKKVVKMALKAAQQIGDGLYGVDLKATDNGVFVIEVNDNPNIEEGVENAVLKEKLYEIVLTDFIRRILEKEKI